MMQDLVLIHGMFGSAGVWSRLRMPLEAAGYRVHAPELPGHGQAAGSVAGMGLAEYMQWLRPLVQTLSSPVLIGHSMGSLLAQKLAAALPVRGLGLLAAVPPRALMPLNLRRLTICWQLFRAYGPSFGPYRMPRKLADARLFAGWAAADADAVWAAMGEESSRILFQMECWPFDVRGSNRVRRQDVRCPVFVADAGHEKMLAPGMGRKIAAHYGAQYRLYPEAGHMLILEPAADRLARDLLQWLETLP